MKALNVLSTQPAGDADLCRVLAATREAMDSANVACPEWELFLTDYAVSYVLQCVLAQGTGGDRDRAFRCMRWRKQSRLKSPSVGDAMLLQHPDKSPFLSKHFANLEREMEWRGIHRSMPLASKPVAQIANMPGEDSRENGEGEEMV
eukprot:3772970-Amphidinium_carterae.1